MPSTKKQRQYKSPNEVHTHTQEYGWNTQIVSGRHAFLAEDNNITVFVFYLFLFSKVTDKTRVVLTADIGPSSIDAGAIDWKRRKKEEKKKRKN